jgi:hypothetical protein
MAVTTKSETRIVCADPFWIGKAPNQNDDFFLCRTIVEDRVLGLIGDFTTGSPRGVNSRCKAELAAFIDERLDTWRQLLLSPDRMLPLIVSHANTWLANQDGSPKTTLIAFLWDAFEGEVHYLSIGDSGLVIGGAGGPRWLCEGDRGGERDATGFLPAKQPDVRIHRAAIAAGEVLVAFTDGFWENTQSFMDDALLRNVFNPAGRDLAAMRQDLATRIIARATKRDDLTLLLFKEEPVSDPTPSPDQTRRHEASRPRVDPAEPTPFQMEIVEILKQTDAIKRGLQKELSQDLADLNERVEQLSQQVAELAEQRAAAPARPLKKEVNSPTRHAGGYTSKPTVNKPTTSAPGDDAFDFQKLIQQARDFFGRIPEWVLTVIFVVVLVALAVSIYMKYWSDSEPTEPEAAAVTVEQPDKTPMAPPVQPFERSLFRLLETNRGTYQAELRALAGSLAELASLGTNISGVNTISIQKNGEPAAVKIDFKSAWINQHKTVEALLPYTPALWLQLKLRKDDSETIFDQLNDTVKTRFVERLGPKIKNFNDLVVALKTKVDGAPAETLKQRQEAAKKAGFTIEESDLHKVAQHVLEECKQDKWTKETHGVIFVQGKDLNNTAFRYWLAENNGGEGGEVQIQETPLKAWLETHAGKADIGTGNQATPIWSLWLAWQVGKTQSGGRPDDARVFGDGTPADFYAKIAQKWSQP